MEKYEEKIKKNRRRKKRNAILTAFSLLLLFTFGFFVGGKISHKKNNVVVSAAQENSKQQEKKPSSEAANKSQSTANNDDNKKSNITSSGEKLDPYKKDGKKIAYLTFDDGPSKNNTPKILDILKNNNIKATFFVIGKNAEQNSDLVKREVAEGHIVGNHTYSHNMDYIYSDTNNCIKDLDKTDNLLKSIIGNDYNLKLIRFPGGTIGRPKLAPYKEAVTKAGYHYVDWNDETGDARRAVVPVDFLLANLKTYTNDDHVVILMHDAPAKTTTVQALPQVIEYLKSKGYTFETLK